MHAWLDLVSAHALPDLAGTCARPNLAIVGLHARHYLACAHAWLGLASAHALPDLADLLRDLTLLVSVHARHYLACAHAWLVLASGHALPDLAGACARPNLAS